MSFDGYLNSGLFNPSHWSIHWITSITGLFQVTCLEMKHAASFVFLLKLECLSRVKQSYTVKYNWAVISSLLIQEKH